MAEGVIRIPAALRHPHPIVMATKKAAARARRRDDGRLEVGGDPGVVRLIVSRSRLPSALLLLQGVFREAERRGYAIAPVEQRRYHVAAGVAIVVRSHSYPIQVSELTDRVPLTDEELEVWRRQEATRFRFRWEQERRPPSGKNVPNGYLRLSLDPRHDGRRSNWSAGPRGGLDRKLPSFFNDLERRAHEDDRRAKERRLREEEHRRRELERIERQRVAQMEQTRAERLAAELTAWRRAKDIGDYIAALRARLAGLEPAERERIEEWCDWADGWRQRTDPTINTTRIQGLAGSGLGELGRAT